MGEDRQVKLIPGGLSLSFANQRRVCGRERLKEEVYSLRLSLHSVTYTTLAVTQDICTHSSKAITTKRKQINIILTHSHILNKGSAT